MPLSNLLADLLDDLRTPATLWQVAAIVGCTVLGWAMARATRAAWRRGRGLGGDQSVEAGSFVRALGPLLIVLLVALAKTMFASLHLPAQLLRLALPLFASLALIRLVFYLLHRVFARRAPLGVALLTVERIFALLVWLGVALYITGLWPELLQYLEQTTLPLGRHKVSLATILQAAVSVVVLLMLALWAGAALEERLMGVQGLHSSLRVVMARMSRALLVVIAVLASLSLVGIDLTVLSVFGGAFGVGLGLGMQKIASNYVSGFVILLERSLSIGDMISVDKYAGKVTRINTRYTVLEGFDGIETVLPNEMLVSGAVQSQSLTTRQLRVATQITVAYDTDLDVLLPLLEQLPRGVPRVLESPAPGVSLNKFSPDGYELELGFWIGDPENGRGGVLSDVNKKIYALIRSDEIKLPMSLREQRLLDARIAAALAATP
ncbi:MAG: mechanosensitive ion channel [Telluria sp.]|nr:mechanosensitive ion channel [Telluria sp.]